MLREQVPSSAPGPHRAVLRNRWFILTILFLARTALAFQFQSVAALGPLLVLELDIDYARLGTLVGLYMLPGVVFALPGGLLGQRFGDKRMALLGLSAMVLGGAWVAFGESYASAVAGRLVSGTGAVLLNILLAKMVADWFAGRETATAMALLLNSWPVGIGIALAALAPLAAAKSVPVALGLTALASLAALVLVAVFYRAPSGLAAAPVSLRFALSRPEWLLAVLSGLIWAFYNVGYIQLLTFGPSFLASRGMPVGEAGPVVSLATWVALVSVPLGGFLAERFGRPNAVMALCFLAVAGAIAALPFGLAPAPGLALIGLLFGPPAGLIMKLPTEVLQPRNRASGMGVYYACYYAAMALVTPLAGLLRDTTGYDAAPLLFAAGLMVASAGVLLVFRALQRRAPRPV